MKKVKKNGYKISIHWFFACVCDNFNSYSNPFYSIQFHVLKWYQFQSNSHHWGLCWFCSCGIMAPYYVMYLVSVHFLCTQTLLRPTLTNTRNEIQWNRKQHKYIDLIMCINYVHSKMLSNKSLFFSSLGVLMACLFRTCWMNLDKIHNLGNIARVSTMAH